jgi:hypothetical protein
MLPSLAAFDGSAERRSDSTYWPFRSPGDPTSSRDPLRQRAIRFDTFGSVIDA